MTMPGFGLVPQGRVFCTPECHMTANNAEGAQKETLPAEPAERLARFIVATRYQDIPETVTEYTKKSILDTLAATIGGSSQAGIDAFVVKPALTPL